MQHCTIYFHCRHNGTRRAMKNYSAVSILGLFLFNASCTDHPEPEPHSVSVNRTEPALIISGEGVYWQVGQAKPGTGAATFTVDTATVIAEWHGFGGTFNERGWAALEALSPEDRNAVLELLFDDENGIGFDWGRIPMGPSDYAVDRYSLSESPGSFDLTRDTRYLIPFIKAAQAVNSDIRFWASPWTPPLWAKTGPSEYGGYDKGSFDPGYSQDYADYFVNWIDAYEQQGIPIDHVQPQNEPGFSQSYPTAAFGPAFDTELNEDVYTDQPVTLGAFVNDYLYPALQASKYKTDLWFGTLSNDKFFSTYWDSLPDKSQVLGVGLQWGTQKRIPFLKQAGMLVMQTEHRCGNYPWMKKVEYIALAKRDTFFADYAPNNHAYAEESWDLIKSWIDDGVNIYSAWNMVLDDEGFNLDEIRPWPQNAMIAVDMDKGTYRVTPFYYLFRHIAQYVDVGAQVVGINGNALAFRNPDDSIVAIIHNPADVASMETIDINGTLLQAEVPARGWVTFNWIE